MIFAMKDCMKCIEIILIWVAVLLPAFSNASSSVSWQDYACVSSGSTCSSNFTEPYCISGDVNKAYDCIRGMETNIFSSVDNVKNIKEAIELYCSSLLWSLEWRVYFSKPSNVSNGWDWQQTFDSRQSLFLEAFCWSFKDENWNIPFVAWSMLSGVYKWDVVKILNLKQHDWKKDLCSLSDESALQNCDLSIYATKIFDGIMSDLFKIEYAQVLDVNTTEKFNVEDNVMDFLKWYYSIDGEYKKIKKSYSKTISVLKSDQKYYKNVLDRVKLIDNSKLAKIAKKSGCPMDGDITWMDFVACALHSSQWAGSALTPSFITLVYNEFLQYQQFITYYTYRLDKKMVHGSEDNDDNKNKSQYNKLQYSAMISDFELYFSMQKEAFKLAQHNLEEFSMTYPLHILILLYTEKIKEFRDKLAEIITPFYSLSEKLQNVQLPPS